MSRPPDWGERATILIVDDWIAGRKLKCRILQHAGYRAVGAGTLAQARRVLSRVPVQLLLLDIHLPDGDGLEFCRALKCDPRHAPMPIAIVSAIAWGKPERDSATAAGASQCLAPPGDPACFLAGLAPLLVPAVAAAPTR